MNTKKRLLVFVMTMLSVPVTTVAQDVWDSDLDGFDDNNDNCTLTFNQDQRDTDGDFFGNMCDSDFNNDQIVNFSDFSFIVDKFLSSDPDADLNGDGFVNFGDVAIFANLFLSAPGPTGTNPDQPPCTCYFGTDCPSGTMCNYGPGQFATEDICVWRNIKPFGVPGAGCSIETNLTTGNWIPGICDGVCTAPNLGSPVGLEDTGRVAEAMLIWGDAMLNPSADGGGPVDPVLAERALALEFSSADVPIMLGRYAADALAMSAGEAFHDYFCHFEGHPEDPEQPIVNLAGNTCRIEAGRMTMQALAAELQTPGTARAIMQNIPSVCSDWQGMFTSQCAAGPGALKCAIQYIEAQAYFLSTAPVVTPSESDRVLQLLGFDER